MDDTEAFELSWACILKNSKLRLKTFPVYI